GGEVTLDDDDYFGDPVVEAARLCASCTAGQILSSHIVVLMAGRRNPHESTMIGPLSLKGLPEPTVTVEILWTPIVVTTAGIGALPALLDERGSFPFAGRQSEVMVLSDAYAEVATGATRLVMLVGEPGIGKTRLTSQFAREVLDLGGLVLAGRSDELVSAPYQPFVEALRWRIEQSGGIDGLGSMAGQLVRLVPELARTAPTLDAPTSASPDEERMVLFAAVREWLASSAEDQPVLLVLDDIHWADMATLLLLRHVVLNDPVAGLLVVATYRDTDVDRTHPLMGMLADFYRRGEVERLALNGLDRLEVTELMALTAEHHLEDSALALAETLTDDTGGNPFFVTEVLRHLTESGAMIEGGSRWVDRAGDPYLPEGIRYVVGRRVSVLPDETQRLLSSASVIGPRFDLELLAALGDASADEVLDALEPAVAAHLIVETGAGSFQFAHALVRETLHLELSTTRRGRLHLLVAQALESAHDPDSVMVELAYHWGETGLSQFDDVAFARARRAAELANDRLAPDEAARWYRIARERLDGRDPAVDAVLLCQLGLAESLSGQSGWQETLLAAARAAIASGDLETAIEALGGSPHGFRSGPIRDPNPEKVALLRTALARPEITHRQRARATLALAKEMLTTRDLDQRRALHIEAMALVNEIPDSLEWIRAMSGADSSIPSSALDRPFLEQVNSRATEARELARERSDPEMEYHSLSWLGWTRLHLGRADFAQIVDDMRALFPAFPSPMLRLNTIHFEYHLAIRRGHIRDARSLLDDYTNTARVIGEDITRMAGLAKIGTIREVAGLGRILDTLASGPVMEAENGGPGPATGLWCLALAESGQIAAAAELLVRVGRHQFLDMPDDGSLPVAQASWAEAAALVGDLRACRAFFERLLPWHDLPPVVGFWYGGSTARYLALLSSAMGRHGEADDWFAEAIGETTRTGSPPWTARAQIDWGERLFARGEVQSAKRLANEALDQIGTLELTVSRNRATELLAACD
ncbi:MAG TPA: AAA family ATPase, partial [Ilumatobacteraceae bacterium]|nr:AAA family ATPase [Ilumatobacteraceae bacterium]